MRSIPTLQSKKRGQVGITDNGVFNNFTGTAVHDCCGLYCRFDNISKNKVNVRKVKNIH